MQMFQKQIGACAVTTKLLDNTFALSIFYCRGVSHEENRVFGRSSSNATPPPQKKCKSCFLFVVSPSPNKAGKRRKTAKSRSSHDRKMDEAHEPFVPKIPYWPALSPLPTRSFPVEAKEPQKGLSWDQGVDLGPINPCLHIHVQSGMKVLCHYDNTFCHE